MYILYKTTNKINGKIYVGIHKTDNLADGYLGSGKQIKSAIKKYGKEAFYREVIECFASLEEARNHERHIVNEEFVRNNLTYNIAIGGGLGSENLNGLTFRNNKHTSATKEKLRQFRLGKSFLTEAGKKAIIEANKKEERNKKIATTLSGKQKSQEHREKISLSIQKLNRENGSPNKGKTKPKIQCPNCLKEGAPHNMYRWHFENCKGVSGE
jgi:hypothetical protein